MNRTLTLFALLLVAACDRQEQSATPAPDALEKAPTPPAAKAPVPSLEGAWTVASAGGAGSAMTVTFGNGKATIVAGCSRRAFTYKQDRNQVAFTSSPAGSSNCEQPPSADQEAAFAALADANMAVFDKDGDATLSGFGGTLALERR